MVKFQFNKLIREKLIKDFYDHDVNVSLREISKNEFAQFLFDKLQEEVKEIINSENIEDIKEEIADVLEVLHTIAKNHKINFEEIEKTRIEKKQKQGGFSKNTFVNFINFDENDPRFESFIKHFRKQPEKYPEIHSK